MPAVGTTKPADMLLGLTVAGEWRVTEKQIAPPSATGGNFSVGYIVENSSGQRAFLKALDYSRALKSTDPARALQGLTEAYNFERDILQKCAGLSRVVTAVVDGSVSVPVNGNSEIVQFLIFEKADGDVRSLLTISTKFDTAWSLRALHHVSTGLYQMHQRKIAHQDVKPSNILRFGTNSSKIGDVGRAWQHGVPAPHENLVCAGDPAYAPLELLYNRVGLIATPSDGTLLNNLAFALANENKLKQAQEILHAIPIVELQPAVDICRDATQGLIAFREGDHSKGRFYYNRAMSKADENQLLPLKIRAGIHLAREELNVDATRAAAVIQELVTVAKPTKDPDLVGPLDRLLDSLLRHKSTKELDAVITDVRRILKPLKQPLPQLTTVQF